MNSNAVPRCPSHADLFGFSVGKLPEDSRETIAEHLSACAHCLSTLETLDAATDPLIADLRQSAPLEPFLALASARLSDHLATTLAASPGLAGAAAVGRPERLGDYRLLEKLGQGGMGAVYKAVHARLGKTVAVKILTPERINSAKALARFHFEMEAVGKLDHPNLVRALDAREEAGVHLLVMEYIEGLDLAKLLQRHGPLPIADACEAIRQAALGLHDAHQKRRLIHRDIKPSNLMLTPAGCIKVLDLGLALLEREAAEGKADAATGPQLTSEDARMGTVDYMAPEQWLDSHAVDTRADVYSLGCTLYHLLAGAPPFAGPEFNTAGKKLLAHAKLPVPPIRARRPDLPADLVAVLERMLAKQVADRLANPATVAAALEPFCAGHDLPALLNAAARESDLLQRPSDSRESVATLPASETDPDQPAAPRPPTAESRTSALPRGVFRRTTAPARPPASGRRGWSNPRRLAAVFAPVLLLGLGVLGYTIFQRERAASLARTRNLSREAAVALSAAPKHEEQLIECPASFLKIKHFRPAAKTQGNADELISLGLIGETAAAPLQHDRITVEAEFGMPVYPYLLAINPDGSSQLLFPDPEGNPAALAPLRKLVYPLETTYLTLDDPGFLGLILLAAPRPLPPFERWKPAVDPKAWAAALPSHLWMFDGCRIDPLAKTRVGTVAHGPKVFADICNALKGRPDVAAVRGMAFTVKGAESQEHANHE